jgi:hypothetical protein
MAMIALGSQNGKRRVAGTSYCCYVGFIIINIELLEIIIDGFIWNSSSFFCFGSSYDVLIASFEILAVLVF